MSVDVIIHLGAEASGGSVMIKFGSCKYKGPTPEGLIWKLGLLSNIPI